jgi:hypothetical protein
LSVADIPQTRDHLSGVPAPGDSYRPTSGLCVTRFPFTLRLAHDPPPLVTENTNPASPLLPDRHPRHDLFICDVEDAVLKDANAVVFVNRGTLLPLPTEAAAVTPLSPDSTPPSGMSAISKGNGVTGSSSCPETQSFSGFDIRNYKEETARDLCRPCVANRNMSSTAGRIGTFQLRGRGPFRDASDPLSAVNPQAIALFPT